MYSTVDFTKLGGLYVYQNTLDILQTAYAQTLNAIANNYGDKVILQGLTDTGGGAVSDGWVCLDGEILPVVGGAVLSYLHLDSVLTNEQFDDGTSKQVYTAKRLLFDASSSGNYAWADFRRLPISVNGTIVDVLLNVQTLFNKTLFETAVILSGCALSNIDTVASTCKINGGIVMIDGTLLNTTVYNGTYPVWLNNEGNYVNAQPSTGGYIKFDYETSQRYADVVKRNIHGSGEIVMSRSADDLAMFDVATGLGKWKWLGWKICDVMQSRMPVGYDRRTSSPGGYDTDVWNISNHSLNNFGGTRTKTLAKFNLPNVQLNVPIPSSATSKTEGNHGRIVMGDNDTDYDGPTLKTEALGSGTAFDVMNPNRVILFIEKI